MGRLLAGFFLAAILAAQDSPAGKVAPYVPSPQKVVDQMLRFAAVKPGERVWDVGSGDGRIVITAAKKFKAQAQGVEIDSELAARSQANIRREGLEGKAVVHEGDMLRQDYSTADVVTIYLLPDAIELLRPRLERQLRPGARVVCHDFPVIGWPAAATETVLDDGNGRSRTLYLYRR